MKSLLSSLATIVLICASGAAQKPLPEGASKFFKELGGLNPSRNKPDILQQIAGNKIDQVESGGGIHDWIKVDGRIFARRAWMVEIGTMTSGYGGFELERSLATELHKKLVAEGFSLTPAKFELHYIRYQKGFTVGTVEVRSYYVKSGNLPLHFEFIFNESYRPKLATRKSERKRP